MRTLPGGTVTLLFTDIEGSTKLLRELGGAYADMLASHRRALRGAFAEHGGVEVDTQGDAFFVAFASAPRAAEAAAAAQAALDDGPVRVRMGLHTGEPTVTDEGYVGLDVHMAARIASSAHGGQVVASGATRAFLDDSIPVIDLGEHRLKDFEEPVPLYQLGDGLFPLLRTISNTNLPRPASSLLGREREVHELLALFRSDARVVTLTGPGGSGKTRLGIEAASELVSEVRAGVYWVGLAPLRDPGLVMGSIAQILGTRDPLEQLIADREMLLVLDNFEHVADAASDVSRLVEHCPNLRVLVTSREVLRIRGETEYEVLPLAPTDAVRLFCERARVDPSDLVAELWERLDDLPLAVELAAARAKVLSPAQILERLSARLDMFRGGRDVDERQQTLRATVEWSHDLLSAEERRLFARLAVFVGGCTLESAEVVTEADVDAMHGLVDKSLLRRTDDRFWMLETIRDFAVERLVASGEVSWLERRHLEHFLALAESSNLAADAEGPQRHALVLAEQANLRAAIDRATGEQDAVAALQLAVAIENFWITQNPTEGARRLQDLLRMATDAPTILRARALRAIGATHDIAFRLDAAEACYSESLDLFRHEQDEAGEARMLHRMGVISYKRGDLQAARQFLEASLVLGRGSGARRIEPQALGTLGEVVCAEGDVERGMDMIQRSVDLCREIGFAWWQEGGLLTLADHGLRLGRYDDVERWAHEALALARRMAERSGVVSSLAGLACSAAARGESERAGLLWGAIEAEDSREPVERWDQDRERYAAALGPHMDAPFEHGREQGRRLPLDLAVDEALRGSEPNPERIASRQPGGA